MIKIGAKSRKLLASLREVLEKLGKYCPNAVKKWIDDLIKKIDDALERLHDAPDPWSRHPKSIQDQMTVDAARKGAGNRIISDLDDPKFKGMEKWEYKVKSANGKDSVVHYVYDPKTGERMDFKFKRHSEDCPGTWENTPDPISPPAGPPKGN